MSRAIPVIAAIAGCFLTNAPPAFAADRAPVPKGFRSEEASSETCYTATKFGIKARCRAEGNGFQVTRHCMSIERGPSRGLLLESVYESDDMSGHGFYVTDLKGNVPLDASLFNQSKTW